MEKISGVIKKKSERPVDTRRGPATVTEIVLDSDPNRLFSTFNKVSFVVGNRVEVEYNVVKVGKFINNNIFTIKLDVPARIDVDEENEMEEGVSMTGAPLTMRAPQKKQEPPKPTPKTGQLKLPSVPSIDKLEVPPTAEVSDITLGMMYKCAVNMYAILGKDPTKEEIVQSMVKGINALEEVRNRMKRK